MLMLFAAYADIFHTLRCHYAFFFASRRFRYFDDACCFFRRRCFSFIRHAFHARYALRAADC